MLDYAVISEIGNRKVNEDCVGTEVRNGNYCFLVCDGLGGHGMGDVASRLVTDIFLDRFRTMDSQKDFLPTTFTVAQEKLVEKQGIAKACSQMRTTVAAAVVEQGSVSIGYIGDSRVYVFDKDGIVTRTIDHSVPQMLALAGKIEEGDIRTHPDRNKILRAMGSRWETPLYTLLPDTELTKCRALLLCTDGFWEYITEAEMTALLNETTSAEEWLAAMSKIVVHKGGGKIMDNYSAIAVINSHYE